MANADNLIITVKIGETGVIATVTLRNTNPATGVMENTVLTGWTLIKMTVSTKSGTVIINQATCVADADQGVNPGKITCTFDALVATYANLIPGDHRLEFKGTNAAGKVRYFPVDDNDNQVYGHFIVKNPLS